MIGRPSFFVPFNSLTLGSSPLLEINGQLFPPCPICGVLEALWKSSISLLSPAPHIEVCFVYLYICLLTVNILFQLHRLPQRWDKQGVYPAARNHSLRRRQRQPPRRQTRRPPPGASSILTWVSWNVWSFLLWPLWLFLQVAMFSFCVVLEFWTLFSVQNIYNVQWAEDKEHKGFFWELLTCKAVYLEVS